MPQAFAFLLTSPFGAARSIAIDSGRSLIGRAPQCAIRIDEPGVPAILGVIDATEHGAFLRPHSERWPLVVNGEPTEGKILRSGDKLIFQSCELVFQSLGEGPVASDKAVALAGARAAAKASPWALFRPSSQAQEVAPPSPSPAFESLPASSAPASPLDLGAASALPDDALPPPAPAREAWPEGVKARLDPLGGSQEPRVELRSDLAMLDLGSGKLSLSWRQGQCHATLLSGVVFCSKDRLGPKPRALRPGELIASGRRVYVFRLPD